MEDGSRVTGWRQIEGSEDVGTDNDMDWYYVDNGEIEHADTSDYITNDDDGPVYVARIRIDGRYFAFNENGQMQTGLQYIPDDRGFYYFDENGYQQNGRVSSVECDDDDYTFYFRTTNGKRGLGYDGINSNTLYFNGKRLDADDDYRLYYWGGDVYLVNRSGRVQRSNKDYAIENAGFNDDVRVEFDGNKVSKIGARDVEDVLDEVIAYLLDATDDRVTNDMPVSIPYIQLYDDDLYTYEFMTVETSGDTTTYQIVEGWMGLNQ